MRRNRKDETEDIEERKEDNCSRKDLKDLSFHPRGDDVEGESEQSSADSQKTYDESEARRTAISDDDIDTCVYDEAEDVLNPAALVKENLALRSKVEELEAKVEEFRSKWIYTFSEYESYRKRVRNEIESEVKNRISKILENFLEAMDSIDAAMTYIQDENTKRGIELIRGLIENALVKSGASKIDVKEGDEFLPSKCEAVEMVPTDVPENDMKVAKILRAGFEIDGRVIRPAKVAVWKMMGEKRSEEERSGSS